VVELCKYPAKEFHHLNCSTIAAPPIGLGRWGSDPVALMSFKHQQIIMRFKTHEGAHVLIRDPLALLAIYALYKSWD
jgi:hypothetical protein